MGNYNYLDRKVKEYIKNLNGAPLDTLSILDFNDPKVLKLEKRLEVLFDGGEFGGLSCAEPDTEDHLKWCLLLSELSRISEDFIILEELEKIKSNLIDACGKS